MHRLQDLICLHRQGEGSRAIARQLRMGRRHGRTRVRSLAAHSHQSGVSSCIACRAPGQDRAKATRSVTSSVGEGQTLLSHRGQRGAPMSSSTAAVIQDRS